MAEDPSGGADFVTVAEAARRLELSERHVRRMSGRLPDTCRTQAGHAPLKVSLSALADLTGKGTDAPDRRRTDAGQTPDTETGDAGHVPDMIAQLADAEKRAAVAEARAVDLEKRVDAAERRADQFHQLADQAQRLHASDQSKIAALEEQNRALLESVKPSVATGGESSQVSGGGRPSSTEASPESPPGGFVARLRRFLGVMDQ